MNDEYYMKVAFELALLGQGNTSPNPLVGAVLVRDRQIIGSGYHKKYGAPLAPASAIFDAKARGYEVEGATLYCNLEPCASLIYEEKISIVVISNIDPNLKVSGKGVQDLRSQGVEVITGILQEEGAELNEIYFKFVTMKTPFIHLVETGAPLGPHKQKCISSLRQKYDCVLVGRKAIEQSNPDLSIISDDFEDVSGPLRIVVGKLFNLNRDWPIFHGQYRRNTMMVASDDEVRGNPEIVRFLDSQGVALLSVKKNDDGSVDLRSMLKSIASLKLTSILIEDEGSLSEEFLKLGLVDKVGF